MTPKARLEVKVKILVPKQPLLERIALEILHNMYSKRSGATIPGSVRNSELSDPICEESA